MDNATAGIQPSPTDCGAGAGEMDRLRTELDGVRRQLERVTTELETFTHCVSHDLGAPIRHIDGFARLLEEQEAATISPEGKRLLERFRGSARSMAALVDGLLQLSRVGRGGIRPRAVDSEAMVRAVWAEIVGQIKTAAVLDLKPLPAIRADPALLRLVWHNLLENAVTFCGTSESPRVVVDSWSENEQVWYRVSDNGVGFDQRYAHKLFTVFQRLHRATEFPGTGVGLAIAKKAIDLHDGLIRGSGAVGQGAVFEFMISAGRS